MDDEDLEDHPENKPENALFYTALNGSKAPSNQPDDKPKFVKPADTGQFKIRGLFSQNFNPNAIKSTSDDPTILKAKRDTKMAQKKPIKVALPDPDSEEDDIVEVEEPPR